MRQKHVVTQTQIAENYSKCCTSFSCRYICFVNSASIQQLTQNVCYVLNKHFENFISYHKLYIFINYSNYSENLFKQNVSV